MNIYIASSWKNQHAVEMLTAHLREKGHTVFSFVEKDFGEGVVAKERPASMPLEDWVASESGAKAFKFDTDGATKSDLVIYIGPSGCDAWAEVGAAWASGVPIIGLHAKSEQVGLMRRMVTWYSNYRDLLGAVASIT